MPLAYHQHPGLTMIAPRATALGAVNDNVSHLRSPATAAANVGRFHHTHNPVEGGSERMAAARQALLALRWPVNSIRFKERNIPMGKRSARTRKQFREEASGGGRW